MTRQSTIAEGIRACGPLMERFLDGFDQDDRATAQPDHLPNHALWTLGHCAMYMHRIGEKIDGCGLPDTDFVTGDGSAGGPERFDTESVCYGSTPVDDPARYPTLRRSIQIYRAACERLAATIENADDTALERTINWGPTTAPLWQIALRMIFHNGTHTGEILALRRALGLGPVIKP